LSNSDNNRAKSSNHKPANFQNDYCLNFEIMLLAGIWTSFFDTEEAHAVMPARVADEGGSAAPQGTATALDMEICG
jgi:hypothetical protein